MNISITSEVTRVASMAQFRLGGHKCLSINVVNEY